ncbi:DUF6902 family protein [Salipiger marinus]|uniref:DUF6902 family protein n=1 Tax=Salipiger marinus TaxID=555512 RepID=UPI00405813E2
MSNIVTLRPVPRLAPMPSRAMALLDCVARHRRREEDVFWLKENAELLNILECTDARLDPGALEAHQAFYDSAAERLAFFPQYYRFLLSITLDLEDLGLPGDQGLRLAEAAARSDLAGAELSDLQRMEACRLLARRGVAPKLADPGLADRLRDFCARAQTFALPNKKAAYELTHIVFYLSEYGRHDPRLAPEAVTSLHFAGNLAFLEQNSDLLSEICIALRYAGQTPPVLWTAWLRREAHLFEVETGPGLSVLDDYHDYLVSNWHLAVIGEEPFRQPLAPVRMRFGRAVQQGTALRELSQALFDLGGGRTADWPVMRGRIGAALSPQALDLLDTLARESAHFDAFFEGFARVARA